MPNKSLAPVPFPKLHRSSAPMIVPTTTEDAADRLSLTSKAGAPDVTEHGASASIWSPIREAVMALTLVLCFLPWCIAVGACIVLSPKHLDLVAFHTGYHNLNEIPRGIRRFAHWA